MKISEPYRIRVFDLFEKMDCAYNIVAQKTGFVCNGCKDNCCTTLFYHHTLLEYLYLKSGLSALSPDLLGEVNARAGTTLEHMGRMEKEGETKRRMMCPLNVDGRCLLYAHRPMICRLHGLPHLLRRPDGQLHSGPGCEDYYAQCDPSTTVRLDRTPLYKEMAKLEQQLRQALEFRWKIKMTVAEIILNNRLPN